MEIERRHEALVPQAGFVDEQRAYVVSMFPYPSGDLHMGHAEVYSVGDAIARYLRLRGRHVLHPIGWDAFGLPAENAARKRGLDPREWTYANIDVQAESLRRMRFSFDWDTRLHTCDLSFFRWTQWIFLRLFEAGLAYRAEAPVNWCPRDETVLANEQVISGRCERCGTRVEQRELTQWFFRTTAYAQRLVDDMRLIEDGWPPEVLTMQRHWIAQLHDWLISRQRKWGTPIPIIHCGRCGLVPAPLPVPLNLPPHTTCPQCGGEATRDPDTMDTFVDSSWYFLRYPNVSYAEGPFDPDRVRQVDEYIGGRDHATGHLIYARFMTKALHDLGMLDFVEPFRRLTCPGQVLLHGKAMSKSLGNLVSLREQLDLHGPDAVRVAILFAGPPEHDKDWAEINPAAAVKWLARVQRLVDLPLRADDPGADFHRLVAATTEAMEHKRFNVAIARLMELTTVVRHTPTREGLTGLLTMLSCFAPITATECLAAIAAPATAAPATAAPATASEAAQPAPAASEAAQPAPAASDAAASAPVRDPDAAAPVRDPDAAAPDAGAPDAGAPTAGLAPDGQASTPTWEPDMAAAQGELAWPAVVARVETATCVVQVDGRVRARLEVPATIGADELEALAREAVPTTGKSRVIVRPPRLVNYVT